MMDVDVLVGLLAIILTASAAGAVALPLVCAAEARHHRGRWAPDEP